MDIYKKEIYFDAIKKRSQEQIKNSEKIKARVERSKLQAKSLKSNLKPKAFYV